MVESISCPECGWQKNIEKYKVYGKVGFSRITCMQCHITANASTWRCSCKLLWHKCDKHILRTLMNAHDRVKGCFERGRHVIKRVNKVKLQGQNRAYPKRRCNGKQGSSASVKPLPTQARTMLKADSILARRFPNLYAKQLR